jgi:pilus assembly protein FimV
MVDSKLDSTLAAKGNKAGAVTEGLKGLATSRLPSESQAHGVAHSAIAKAAASAQTLAPTTLMATRTPDKLLDRPSERAAAMAEAQRAVTVDEQIDLEQEADFFIALGHDDAAIDLLLAHLRTTGGAVPMPYLKLMELYRRRGDRDDHDLMRRRFNQRFNSVAPEWDHDPHAGKLLEEYPALVARLQKVWPKPLDAMAELEAMAFGRRDDNQEVIDLPAYQEVLFLFHLARTLHDDGAAGNADDVDVLLPLSGQDTAAQVATDLSLDFDVSTQPGQGTVQASGPIPYRPNTPGALPSIDTSMVPGPARATSNDKA